MEACCPVNILDPSSPLLCTWSPAEVLPCPLWGTENTEANIESTNKTIKTQQKKIDHTWLLVCIAQLERERDGPTEGSERRRQPNKAW